MNFWETVDSLREYKNISRKELAYFADFSLTSLSTGIKRNSIPSADVALRIAKVLDVSIEDLLQDMNISKASSTTPDRGKSKIQIFNRRIKKTSLPCTKLYSVNDT